MAVPITWQLKQDSPLRRWFQTVLPNVSAVPDAPPVRLRAVVPRGRPDTLPPWLIGMAFDWRLRIGIEAPQDPSSTTAHAGWCFVQEAAEGRSRTSPVLAAEASEPNPVVRLVEAALAARGDADGVRDERALARISVALARYEACYRGGVRDDDPLLQLGAAPRLDDLLDLCPDAAAHEITRLTAVARRGLTPLFPASHVELNPDFTTHGIPADGDIVIDHVLVDLKTVGRPLLDADWLWQVLAYVFLDQGRRGIERVGIYLSRHGWLGTWPVDGLLMALAGRPVVEDELRAEFIDVASGWG